MGWVKLLPQPGLQCLAHFLDQVGLRFFRQGRSANGLSGRRESRQFVRTGSRGDLRSRASFDSSSKADKSAVATARSNNSQLSVLIRWSSRWVRLAWR
jgi:hypothetical protein